MAARQLGGRRKLLRADPKHIFNGNKRLNQGSFLQGGTYESTIPKAH
jgi:hypothetical protein